jgi:hypothetical protein
MNQIILIYFINLSLHQNIQNQKRQVVGNQEIYTECKYKTGICFGYKNFLSLQ